jgi:spore germination protein GerM
MSRREANLLTGLVLFLFGVTLALTAPRWARLLREPVGSLDEEISGRAAAQGVRADDEARRTISVKLYFPDAQTTGLLGEEREVPFSSDLSRQIRSVVEELVKGPRTPLLAALAPEAKVLEVFVSTRGVAYVDLSSEVQALPSPGSQGELLSVYALVNSVAANFPAVKRVQLLVDDRPIATLGGHVDLSRPLLPDMTFLVQASPSPSPGAGANPGAQGAAAPAAGAPARPQP